MNAKKFYLLMGIVLLMGMLPQRNVSADMGPKPTMTFEFVQEVPGPNLTMVSWSLINCRNYDCGVLNSELSDVIPFPLNNFNCADNHCDAYINYLTNENYFQMEIAFSDGEIRTSNVFTRKYFEANYSVEIRLDSLYVKELRGSNLEIILTIIGVVYELVVYEIPSPVLLGIIILVVIVVFGYTKNYKDGKEKLIKRLAKVFFFWPLLIILMITGLIMNAFSFLITLLVEFALAYLYLRYRNLPAWDILRGVVLANFITQPVFVLALTIGLPLHMISLPSIILFEVVICLAEGFIIYFVQQKQLPFRRILLLAFILNVASFGIGLLLPI